MKIYRQFSPIKISIDTELELDLLTDLLRSYEKLERDSVRWGYRPSQRCDFARILYKLLKPTEAV